MRRRDFIILIVGAAVAPLGANAQHGESTRRIGVLLNLAADDAEGQARVALAPDVILANGTPTVAPFLQATQQIADEVIE